MFRGVRVAVVVGCVIALGACSSSHRSATTIARGGGSPEPSNTATTSVRSTSVDGCLVGRWVEDGELDRINVHGNEIESMGGAGITLDFTTTGHETADYSRATPIEGSNNGIALVFTERGTATFEVTTGGSQLTFLSADWGRYSGTETFGGEPVTLPTPQLPAPEFYQCTAQQFTENANGYRAVYHRG